MKSLRSIACFCVLRFLWGCHLDVDWLRGRYVTGRIHVKALTSIGVDPPIRAIITPIHDVTVLIRISRSTLDLCGLTAGGQTEYEGQDDGKLC